MPPLSSDYGIQKLFTLTNNEPKIALFSKSREAKALEGQGSAGGILQGQRTALKYRWGKVQGGYLRCHQSSCMRCPSHVTFLMFSKHSFSLSPSPFTASPNCCGISQLEKIASETKKSLHFCDLFELLWSQLEADIETSNYILWTPFRT